MAYFGTIFIGRDKRLSLIITIKIMQKVNIMQKVEGKYLAFIEGKGIAIWPLVRCNCGSTVYL